MNDAISPDTQYLGESIRSGFADLANRSAGGDMLGKENMAIPAMEIADALRGIVGSLANIAEALDGGFNGTADAKDRRP